MNHNNRFPIIEIEVMRSIRSIRECSFPVVNDTTRDLKKGHVECNQPTESQSSSVNACVHSINLPKVFLYVDSHLPGDSLHFAIRRLCKPAHAIPPF